MSDPNSTPPRSLRKPRIVVLISAAVAIFMLTASLLYYRWATMSEPSCVVVVQTSPALREAEIKVDGLALIAGPLKAIVGVSGRYAIPFYLDPGDYTIDVTMNDQAQYHGKITLTRQQPAWSVDLTRLQPTTNSTTLPAPPVF